MVHSIRNLQILQHAIESHICNSHDKNYKYWDNGIEIIRKRRNQVTSQVSVYFGSIKYNSFQSLDL